ncbi:MAG TPA: methionine--tRNA ligase [Acidimicrobiales bacterium]|nr:methionine--tRNA ligase [Acidimicrobiales bacterium]
MTSTYLTVAIPYVNARPHLGYAYELVLADVAARARRARGDGAVRLLGGTDDFALKNVLAAEAAGVPTRTFVDAHAERFAALALPLDVAFDDFLRTSADARHVPAVTRLWQVLADAGELYRRPYEGDYCVGCERFLAPDERVDGRCPEHRTPTERVAEDNWFFRLSAHRDLLDHLLASGRLAVAPEPFRAEALAFVRRGLGDVSVSRSAERARGWGVPVPGDPQQVVYVWFDALAYYLSALGYGEAGTPAYRRWWAGPGERVHVVGKGILRFHAVLWPALLAAAGEPLPTRVQVHPYLTVAGAKLSKSSGTTLDPADVVARCGTDALRWWFARDVHPVVDTDVTVERVAARADAELAGGLGNVVHRIATLAHRHRAGAADRAPLPAVAGLAGRVADALAGFDLRGGSRQVVEAVAALNRDVEEAAPWTLARDPDRREDLDRVLGRQLATAREVVTAVAPIVPGLAGRLLARLTPSGGRLPAPTPAVARIRA